MEFLKLAAWMDNNMLEVMYPDASFITHAGLGSMTDTLIGIVTLGGYLGIPWLWFKLISAAHQSAINMTDKLQEGQKAGTESIKQAKL